MDLIPCNDKETFISDIQKAFQESYEKEFGPCPKTILPRKDIEQSFSTEGAKIFFATENGKIVGGAVVVINEQTDINHLDLLYVKPDCQSKSLGLNIWQSLEKMFPQTKKWETYTPYFDKRNIHFYVNKCGFHIVEFFNPAHRDPNVKNGEVGGMDKEVGQYFFRFEKALS